MTRVYKIDGDEIRHLFDNEPVYSEELPGMLAFIEGLIKAYEIDDPPVELKITLSILDSDSL